MSSDTPGQPHGDPPARAQERAQERRGRRLPLRLACGILAGGLVAMGSTGTWMSVLFLKQSGMDGDGVFTLPLGLVAGLLLAVPLFERRPRGLLAFVAVGLFAAAGVIGGYDWQNIVRAEEADVPLLGVVAPQVGWGLVLVVVASVVGAILAAVEFFAPAGSGER